MFENNKHEHHHDHDETCGCGHEHHHEHGEDCGCGHEHHHEHDENCGCGEQAAGPGVITVGHTFHDEAIIVSGAVTLFGRYENVKEILKERLEAVSEFVSGQGGIVGHIKASASVTAVEMFSTTGEAATVKTSPEQEIRINMVAIVFAIAPDEVEKKVLETLSAVKDKA